MGVVRPIRTDVCSSSELQTDTQGGPRTDGAEPADTRGAIGARLHSSATTSATTWAGAAAPTNDSANTRQAEHGYCDSSSESEGELDSVPVLLLKLHPAQHALELEPSKSAYRPCPGKCDTPNARSNAIRIMLRWFNVGFPGP